MAEKEYKPRKDTNTVILTGHLVSAPELRYTPTGKQTTSFRIAVNDFYTDASGKIVETTSYVNCQAWNGTAKALVENKGKGNFVLVEGELSIRQLPAQNGEKPTYWTEVKNCRVQFLDFGNRQAQPEQEAEGEIPF